MSTVRHRLRSTRTSGSALALTAVALLAACSSGGGGGAATSAATSTAPAGSTSTTPSVEPSSSSAAAPTTAVTSAAAIAHVCSLLPMAEAARITGIALQPDIDSARECSYDRADSSEHLAVVTVALDSGADQPHQYDFDRSHPIGTDTLVDVPGVGEKAFYSSGFKMLVTLKGQHLLHISITDTHVADPRRADIAIAQLVLPNL